jgi:hypothetical protein
METSAKVLKSKPDVSRAEASECAIKTFSCFCNGIVNNHASARLKNHVHATAGQLRRVSDKPPVRILRCWDIDKTS